jgi:sulfane dehydrogenase subunit SoxC
MTPQQVDGMMSTSEWTGVPLSVLFKEAGVKRDAKWFLAEGGDACLLARSIPVSKGRDDALVVWAQNGEPLRPEQGFPIRLLVPGWEGNANVKWLRRMEFATDPFMTRWETSKYTDPLPGGKARQFSFELDAKSIITTPAFPEKLSAPGFWRISGLAWSGRGKISRVEITTDGGKTWSNAELLTSPSPKAPVRFEYMWEWRGDEHLLMSRAVDDQAYVQPTMAQLKAVRGPGTDYHFNAIRGWRVARDGTVTFEGNT